MDDPVGLTERFEENRPRLRGLAYRMLGSLCEAEDAVQEAWLRLHRADTAAVDNLGGWLTTVVSRVCLDVLRSRRSRREEPIGAQVAGPSVVRGDGADPEGEAALADSVGVALLVERAALALGRPAAARVALRRLALGGRVGGGCVRAGGAAGRAGA